MEGSGSAARRTTIYSFNLDKSFFRCGFQTVLYRVGPPVQLSGVQWGMNATMMHSSLVERSKGAKFIASCHDSEAFFHIQIKEVMLQEFENQSKILQQVFQKKFEKICRRWELIPRPLP